MSNGVPFDAPLSRRTFLRASLAGAAAAAFPGSLVAANTPPISRRGAPKRVLVIGAGLAGLSAAYELAAAGHDVTILEARARPGGRVYTLREPFPDGLYAEAGATRISDTHDWVMKYVERFGLALDDFKAGGKADVYHVGGRRLIVSDERAVDWPLALSPEERRLGLDGMRAKYIRAMFDRIGDAGAPEAPPASLSSLDVVSYGAFLKGQGASAAAVSLLAIGTNSNTLDRVSALMRLRAAVWRGRTRRWSKIRGGNDQLPKVFAAALSDRIYYRTPINRIEQANDGVTVFAQRAGVTVSFSADYLVCTIPCPVLRKLPIRPALPEPVRRAIMEYGYSTATKTYLQTRSRFWEAEGLSGFGVTDRPLQEIWHITSAQPGRRGILLTYTTGSTVARLGGRLTADRVRWSAHQAEAMFPGLQRELEGTYEYCWDEDPWAGAGWPDPAPGQLIPFATTLRQPVGRIYFAGDHVSAWPAWMQGALESGNHVARAIDAAP